MGSKSTSLRRPSCLTRTVLLLLLSAITSSVLASCSSAIPASSVTHGGSHSTNIWFHVDGNRILEPNGEQFAPYGFVLWCLSSPRLTCNSARTSDRRKILVAATYWHANTVRLQVAWEHLFGAGNSVNRSYLRSLDGEVALANHHHMVAIVTLQTERYRGSLFPDTHALSFWRFMARHFEHNPMVFFDLFNEPRLGGPLARAWRVWRDGGTVRTPKGVETYVGMQQLVGVIRGAGARNVIIAEGIKKDTLLTGVPMLKGTNIAYGIEPSLRPSGPVPDVTPRQWQANWAALSNRVPIMMEAFLDAPGSSACNPRSPSLLPKLLQYLKMRHLGLIYFSLSSGLAVIGHDLERPTTFPTSRYDCSAKSRTSIQGPGQDLLNWFRANSRPVG